MRYGLAVAVALGALAPPALASIPIEAVDLSPSTTQAGAHPNLTVFTDLSDDEPVISGDDVRNLRLELPPGLIVGEVRRTVPLIALLIAAPTPAGACRTWASGTRPAPPRASA